MSIPVVTIDGPSGAGKGTVSRAVAMQLGWGYLEQYTDPWLLLRLNKGWM